MAGTERIMSPILPSFCLAAAVAVGGLASATSGDLDTSFHSGLGFSTIAFDLGGNNTDTVEAVLIQSNGDIVLVGYVDTVAGSEVALTRLLPDGTLDGSFGTSGRTHVAVPNFAIAGVSGAALDPGDGIYVTGYQGYLAHFTANGALDTSFATSGFFSTTNHFESVAVDRAGKPVVVGSDSDRRVLAIRLTAAGQPDSAFNSSQPFAQQIGTGSPPSDNAWSVTFDNNGRIYLGALAGDGGFGGYFGIVRLTANGLIDTTCNSNGIVLFTSYSSSQLTPMSILFRDAHHIILTGSVSDGSGPVFAYDFDSDDCSPGTGPGMIAFGATKFSGRAAVASDGAVYISYGGASGESQILAVHNGLPYTDQPFTIYPTMTSAGAGIVMSTGRPLQAIQQQVSGTNYDFAVARFFNDRILYANFDRDAPN
jgi:uncharacterized delta-60 repeat protein